MKNIIQKQEKDEEEKGGEKRRSTLRTKRKQTNIPTTQSLPTTILLYHPSKSSAVHPIPLSCFSIPILHGPQFMSFIAFANLRSHSHIQHKAVIT